MAANYQMFSQLQGPNIVVDLFGNAARTGTEIGKAIPTGITAAITGLQSGITQGLDWMTSASNLQTAEVNRRAQEENILNAQQQRENYPQEFDLRKRATEQNIVASQANMEIQRQQIELQQSTQNLNREKFEVEKGQTQAYINQINATTEKIKYDNEESKKQEEYIDNFLKSDPATRAAMLPDAGAFIKDKDKLNSILTSELHNNEVVKGNQALSDGITAQITGMAHIKAQQEEYVKNVNKWNDDVNAATQSFALTQLSNQSLTNEEARKRLREVEIHDLSSLEIETVDGSPRAKMNPLTGGFMRRKDYDPYEPDTDRNYVLVEKSTGRISEPFRDADHKILHNGLTALTNLDNTPAYYAANKQREVQAIYEKAKQQQQTGNLPAGGTADLSAAPAQQTPAAPAVTPDTEVKNDVKKFQEQIEVKYGIPPAFSEKPANAFIAYQGKLSRLEKYNIPASTKELGKQRAAEEFAKVIARAQAESNWSKYEDDYTPEKLNAYNRMVVSTIAEDIKNNAWHTNDVSSVGVGVLKESVREMSEANTYSFSPLRTSRLGLSAGIGAAAAAGGYVFDFITGWGFAADADIRRRLGYYNHLIAPYIIQTPQDLYIKENFPKIAQELYKETLTPAGNAPISMTAAAEQAKKIAQK